MAEYAMEDSVSEPAEVIETGRLTPLWRVYANMLFAGSVDWNPEEQVPQVVLRQRGVRADVASVNAYRRLCGEGPPDTLPPMYPHVLATPLQLNLLDSDYFPLPLAGLVHMGQQIDWHMEIPLNAEFDFECGMNGPQQSEHGWEFTMQTFAYVKGELAWHERLMFLKPDRSRRARPNRRSREGDANHFIPLLHLQFPEGSGRRYAQVSGDWNPIHLWKFTAKRFGFNRPIAHGMFTLARCLALLEARGVTLTGKRLDARFRAPVMLPAFTNFCLQDKDPDHRFALTDARKGRILVEGRLDDLE